MKPHRGDKYVKCVYCYVDSVIHNLNHHFGLLIISSFFRKSHAAKWKYWIWLIISLRLVFLFNISIPQTPFLLHLPTQIEIEHNFINSSTKDVGSVAKSETASTDYTHTDSAQNISMLSKTAIPIYQIIISIWAIGSIMFFTIHMVAYFAFKKSVRRWCKKVTNDSINNILQSLLSDLCLNDIEIKICKKAHSPMMIGFYRPVLLLPHEQYSNEDLSVILKHELIHYKRHDIWYKLLLLVVNSIHWFNPLVYLMVREANKDIELFCDAEVVEKESVHFRKQYCEIILSVTVERQNRIAVLSTYFREDKKSLKQRFANVFNTQKEKNGSFLLLAIALLIIITSLLVGFTFHRGNFISDTQTKNTVFDNSIHLLDVLDEQSLSDTYNNDTLSMIKASCVDLINENMIPLDGFTHYYNQAVSEYKAGNSDLSFESFGKSLNYLVQLNIPQTILNDISADDIVDIDMPSGQFIYYRNNSTEAIGKSSLNYANDNEAALQNGVRIIDKAATYVTINAQRAISGVLYKFCIDIGIIEVRK